MFGFYILKEENQMSKLYRCLTASLCAAAFLYVTDAASSCDVAGLKTVCKLYTPSRGFPAGDFTCDLWKECSVELSQHDFSKQPLSFVYQGQYIEVDLSGCYGPDYYIDCALIDDSYR